MRQIEALGFYNNQKMADYEKIQSHKKENGYVFLFV